jgi:hypothetical protein
MEGSFLKENKIEEEKQNKKKYKIRGDTK